MQLLATSQIEDTQALKIKRLGQVQESAVRDQFAVIHPQLAEVTPACQKACDRLISNQTAVMQIDFEHRGAIVGYGSDGFVRDEGTVVKLEL